MTIDEIKKNLLSLLKENETNEAVFDWIDANVAGNSEPLFIRALVTAVHENVITGSGSRYELGKKLKARTTLLRKYFNHDEKLELQALYAIQALMNQLGQPNGLMRRIFAILFDNSVITKDTFKAWESSTDPKELEGKEEALHSVKSFYTWLYQEDSKLADEAHIQRLTEMNRVVPQIIPQQIRSYNDPFKPNYARGGAPRLTPVNRSTQQGWREKPRKIITFTNSLNQNIKLHESENPWKPLNKLSLIDVVPEELEKEKLKRSVRSVLNKLTPQNFDALLAQVKGFNIDTEEKLSIIVDLIFDHVIQETKIWFGVSFSNLCKHLAVHFLIKVHVADRTGGQVNFRKLLLTKCQKEFEQDRSVELKHEERMKAIEEAEPEKQKEMKLEFELEEKKMRHRRFCNIRFTGELFKLGLLIEPIMHECIKKLLSQGDEESLEGLCILLKTIGKELDDSKSNQSSRDQTPMVIYFAQMQRYVDKRLTSSRVRFMLQDVIDLKKSCWVPRRDENMPKTIRQIHLEAEREAREQQIDLQNMSTSNYPKRMPDDRDRRKAAGRNIFNDGWISTSSMSNKGSYTALDPTKLKLTKPDEVESIRIGPGGRGLSSWGRGSSGGSKAAEEAKTATTNRYSALESLSAGNYDGRRGSQRSAASSHSHSNQLSTASSNTSSTSTEKVDLLETIKLFNKEPKEQDTTENDVHVNNKAADTKLPNSQMAIDIIQRNLFTLLKENKTNEAVFDWIDANVPEYSEPTFIRTLVKAVHEHVITGSGGNYELSAAQLKARTTLLTRYINHNEKLELQALYAIQALINQLGQPNGLLHKIFDILYDDDVITEETFKVWESSTDPNESEGKGVAVHSVKKFFIWLRESESEPEE